MATIFTKKLGDLDINKLRNEFYRCGWTETDFVNPDILDKHNMEAILGIIKECKGAVKNKNAANIFLFSIFDIKEEYYVFRKIFDPPLERKMLVFEMDGEYLEFDGSGVEYDGMYMIFVKFILPFGTSNWYLLTDVCIGDLEISPKNIEKIPQTLEYQRILALPEPELRRGMARSGMWPYLPLREDQTIF
jgi:hypothetical protein